MGVLIGIFIHIPVGFKDTHTEKVTVCFSLSITFRHGHGNTQGCSDRKSAPLIIQSVCAL